MENIVTFFTALCVQLQNGLVTLSELESVLECCHLPFSKKEEQNPNLGLFQCRHIMLTACRVPAVPCRWSSRCFPFLLWPSPAPSSSVRGLIILMRHLSLPEVKKLVEDAVTDQLFDSRPRPFHALCSISQRVL